MGGSQSSTVRSINQSINQNLNNIVRDTMTDTTAVQINKNLYKINVDRIIGCKEISNEQNIDANQQIKSIMKVSNTAELSSKLNEAMSATAQSNQKAVNDFLSTTFQAQQTKVESLNYMKNIVNNNINDTNLQKVNAVIDNVNKYELNAKEIICGRDGKISNIQSIATNQVATAMQDVLNDILIRNETVRKGLTASKAKQDSEQKGLGGVLGQYFIMIAIIVIALIVGGIFLFKSLLSSPEAMDIVKSKVGGGGGGAKPF